jgi:hypothetical protein
MILLLHAVVASTLPPDPPVWPDQFHATLLQNRSNDLALVSLFYDYKNGRNYNLITPQLMPQSTLFDLEYSNGTTFYYFPNKSNKTCTSIAMGVGLLRPDWLNGSKYLGRAWVDDFECDVYNQVRS